ncbi:MAG: ABC transporter permease [Chloroflexota bacterium]|nr:ABC transporter permease [Chloroflexota bacterium]
MRLSALAWRGLIARPLRTTLTVLGVAFGVAIITATLVANQAATDAVERAARELFGHADLRVRAFADTGLTARAVTALRSLPDVAAAAAVSERQLQMSTLPGPQEQVFDNMLVIGVDPDDDKKVRDPSLVAGTFLTGPDANEVLLNATWAADHHLSVGVRMQFTGDRRPGPPSLRIVGLLDDVGFGALANGAVAVVPRSMLEDAFANDTTTTVVAPVTSVDLVAKPGRVAQLQDELDATLREPFVVETVADAAAQLNRAQNGFAGIAFLFGLIALAVGGFLVANTMAMTLGERTREVGLLRAAGTTSRQVLGIFGRQALFVGITGSAIGVLLGIAVAAGMIGFLRSTRAVLIDGLPLNPWSLLLAFAIGAAVTFAAAALPARAAARIGPLEALRPSRQPNRSLWSRLRWLLGLELAILIVGLVAYPLARGSASLPAILLALAALIGGAALTAIGIEPIGRVVARPLEWFFGAEAVLGRVQLGRDRARSGLTVAALLIGLAAVVALGTVAESARGTAKRWVDSILPGGYAVRLGIATPSDELRPTFEATTGVRTVTPIVEFPAVEVIGGDQRAVSLAGIDPAVFRDAGSLIFTAGDRGAAFAALSRGRSVLVPEPIAQRDKIKVGDTLQLGLPGSRTQGFAVAGTIAYSIPSRSGEGDLLISLADAKARFGTTDASLWALLPRPGVSDTAFRAAVTATANSLAGQALTAEDLASDLSRSLDRLIGLFDALALIAVAIAALGIVNTLSVGVIERVREIAILRSHGMTVRQVQSMVVTEAAIMGVVGGLAAAGTGLVVAWALIAVGSASEFGTLSVPWSLLGITVLLGVGIATLAGIYPARIAARLPIVGSLRHFE